MQTDTSLLKCGETATSNQVDRLGLSPLPITTGRNPIAISQFITTTESGLLKIRLVNANVHLTQIFLVQFFVVAVMILLFWLNVGEMWQVAFPMFGFGTLCFFIMYYITFKDDNQMLAGRPAILLHSQKKQVLLAKPTVRNSIPAPPSGDGKQQVNVFNLGRIFWMLDGNYIYNVLL